jgi:phosphate-selective porin
MGLDLVTSSRDITFMEPAAPLQAIAPPNMVGLQIGHPVFSERATWALGVFGDATPSTEYGNASKNYGSAIGRLTWLGLDHLDPDHPAANRFLHLGVSADCQYSVTSNVRYQSRPETTSISAKAAPGARSSSPAASPTQTLTPSPHFCGASLALAYIRRNQSARPRTPARA